MAWLLLRASDDLGIYVNDTKDVLIWLDDLFHSSFCPAGVLWKILVSTDGVILVAGTTHI